MLSVSQSTLGKQSLSLVKETLFEQLDCCYCSGSFAFSITTYVKVSVVRSALCI